MAEEGGWLRIPLAGIGLDGILGEGDRRAPPEGLKEEEEEESIRGGASPDGFRLGEGDRICTDSLTARARSSSPRCFSPVAYLDKLLEKDEVEGGSDR